MVQPGKKKKHKSHQNQIKFVAQRPAEIFRMKAHYNQVLWKSFEFIIQNAY